MLHEDEALKFGRQAADLASLAKALSDENRLRILFLMSSGKTSVSQLVERSGLSQPLVSHHLRELKRIRLVEVERKGPFVYYWLDRPEVIDLMRRMSSLTDSLIADRERL
jgi:DNA-binding transcriptional ArsR family regulator